MVACSIVLLVRITDEESKEDRATVRLPNKGRSYGGLEEHVQQTKIVGNLIGFSKEASPISHLVSTDRV